MHLSFNENKTKRMQCTKVTDSNTHLEIGSCKFEKVTCFTYLDSEVNIDNTITPEIFNGIPAANRCFFGLRKYLKSSLIKRKTKLAIYKSLIRSVFTYSSETWILTKKDEESLGVFERKILRSIFGGKQINGVWHRESNLELYLFWNSTGFGTLPPLRTVASHSPFELPHIKSCGDWQSPLESTRFQTQRVKRPIYLQKNLSII